MKYHDVLQLIEDPESKLWLSVPGLVTLGKVPEPCKLAMEKQLALGLINSVLTAFTDRGYTVDVIEFQIACSGNDVIFLLNPAFNTVH
jgi:hypothetical protein